MLAMISTCFFVTQLIVDFICAGIVDKLGYRACIIAAEVTSGLGLAGLAFIPDILPSPYAGIIVLMVCAGSSEIAMAQWASAFA